MIWHWLHSGQSLHPHPPQQIMSAWACQVGTEEPNKYILYFQRETNVCVKKWRDSNREELGWPGLGWMSNEQQTQYSPIANDYSGIPALAQETWPGPGWGREMEVRTLNSAGSLETIPVKTALTDEITRGPGEATGNFVSWVWLYAYVWGRGCF